MNKVLLIIQREYITRVRKKSFIIMIFVVPLLILGMGALTTFIAKNTSELDSAQTVKVVDQSNVFKGKFHDAANLKFENASVGLKEAKKQSFEQEGTSVLYIPVKYNAEDSIEIFSKKKPSAHLTSEIEKQLNDIAIKQRFADNHINPVLVQSITKSDISVKAVEITENGDKDANVGANVAVGIAGAILIYLSLFIYGGQVMRGVIEEKTSRIIEVIISSVKPFQLMLGKIIGVGLVGLTQFAAWIILSVLASKVAGHAMSGQQGFIAGIITALKTIPFGFIMICFLFYFLTGYLLYAALFAAVGSAVDSETETQQFMFPITLPLLFTYILSVSVLFQSPDSALATWLSIIPFTSPVAMMVRLPFGVPAWQLALSMFLMICGFVFTVYVAARIYRVGILMYGKKASYKELTKWFFYKE